MDQKKEKVFLTFQDSEVSAKTWNGSCILVFCFSIEPIPLDNEVYLKK